MKQLLIDAGNTRLKWRVLQGARAGRVQALPWQPASAARAARGVLRDAAGATRILVCSVAGLPLERALRAAAHAARCRGRCSSAARGVRPACATVMPIPGGSEPIGGWR
jgi:Type III pantothenate kinase